MGVYIKDMEMPKRCAGCFLRVGQCSKRIYMENRPSDCPLVEVPEPHGRLIDADAFEKENAYFWERDFVNPKYEDTLADLVNAAPTIIEAEGET